MATTFNLRTYYITITEVLVSEVLVSVLVLCSIGSIMLFILEQITVYRFEA